MVKNLKLKCKLFLINKKILCGIKEFLKEIVIRGELQNILNDLINGIEILNAVNADKYKIITEIFATSLPFSLYQRLQMQAVSPLR